MTELRLTSVELPTAPLGPSSPLPMLEPIDSTVNVADDVPRDIVARSRQGAPPTLHPYLSQDDYGRELSPRQHRVAVLENDCLRATIALDLGGRLLSLYDRRVDRELLYVNPVVQPANLALRNAWISGGVEWNIGTRGHSPTTMDTLHAAEVVGPDGDPMLRLWEWERMRGVVFQIDLWLPHSHPVLLARTRLRNTNDVAVPTYWWTNVAVVAAAGTRVLAPARRAFRTMYPNGLRVAAVPDDGNGDTTFPERHRVAADFFYDIAGDQRSWIAAVRTDGSGIAHTSTVELRGRKLFVWGTGNGGKRWQEWLSHGGRQHYAEIQAGLAPTQFEHVTMPARSELAWTEAFGAIDVDTSLSHGHSWTDAVAHTGAAVDGLVDAGDLANLHTAAGAVADTPPRALITIGSGWGALERRRRMVDRSAWFDDAPTPFLDSTLGSEQEPWLALLERGSLPPHQRDLAPVSYVASGEWEARLAASPHDWLTEYHLAVMAHGAGDRTRAIAGYKSSLRHARTAWALRGLAEAARADRRPADAARYAVEAWREKPREWRLAAEAVGRLLDANQHTAALALVDALPGAARLRGRIKLLEAWAAVGAGDEARAQAILDGGLVVPDLREGERSIDQLWRLVHPDTDVPPEYDFRMVEA